MAIHPLQAGTLGEMGVDYWIERFLCKLLAPPTTPGFPQPFVDALESIRERGAAALVERLRWLTGYTSIGADATLKRRLEQNAALLPEPTTPYRDGVPDLSAWEAATRALVAERLEGKPFQRDSWIDLQPDRYTRNATEMLAMARQGLKRLRGESEEIRLAAPLVPRADEPVVGSGPIDVYFVGDLSLPTSGVAFMHVFVRHGLGDLERYVTLRWRHGATGWRRGDFFAANVAAVVARRDRQRFWDAIDWLYRNHALCAAEQLPPTLDDLPLDGRRLAEEARGDTAKRDVSADLHELDVCGVPRLSPTFVVGTRPFIGVPHGDAVSAEIRRLVGA